MNTSLGLPEVPRHSNPTVIRSVRVHSMVEPLETRIAPATHVWTGLGANNLWSNSQNWTNGAPNSDLSGDVDLVFSTNLVNVSQLATQNDINGLVVDSITFNANAGVIGLTTFATGGTSKDGYTIDGLPIFINTASAGQDPFGIDVAAGGADPASGITHTFNVGLIVFGANATFHSQEAGTKLTFNGFVTLGGNTLTIDNAGGTTAVMAVNGDLSNGSLIKNSSGTLQLTGNNSYTNVTVNSGNLFADSDGALGSSAGTATVNDPARIILHNGVTVSKGLLNLNSNALGGGIGADGNTTNTFRGPVVLMAGAGGVAMGAGTGTANAGTRLIIDGVISGATSTLSLNGAGVIEFTQNNTYTGLTNHNGNNGFGAIQIDAPAGLGAGGAGNETQLNRNGAGPAGSALWLNFNGSLQDGASVGERIQFAGAGVGSLGAIRSLGNSNVVVPGNITFIAGAPWTIGVDGDLGSITTLGVIDDQGTNRALTKVGAGTLNISGINANTYSGGTIVKEGTLSVANISVNPLGDTPTVAVPNAVTLSAGTTLSGGATFPNTVTGTGILVSPGFSPATLGTGAFLIDAASTFRAELNGVSAGSQHDQLAVTGAVSLNGATLDLRLGFKPVAGTQFTIIDNDGNADAVTGTFNGLAEGARLSRGGSVFTISYTGGDGNDVVLTTVTPLSDLTLSNGNKTATFTDVDGDLVTVKTTVGQFAANGSDFTFASTGDNRQALQKLVLGGSFTGANISITAKPTANGGNGFVNVGFLDATGVDLGTVVIGGDLGQIKAGTVGGNASVPGVKSLTVQSLGLLNSSVLLSSIEGALPTLTIKGDLRASLEVNGATDGKLGTASIGGTFTTNSTSVVLRTGTGIGSLKIGGDIRNSFGGTVSITTGGPIGSLQVLGGIAGISTSNTVLITSFGQITQPASGLDIAIGKLMVGGSAEFLIVRAGDAATDNADASIGSITVGGDWIGSTVQAGTNTGPDGRIGTNDDVKFSGGATRDQANIFSQIGSFTVKGQALGTLSSSNDMFGVVAERIGTAKVGGRTFAFVPDAGLTLHREAFFAAPTGPGVGTEAPVFDFTIRELGSTTPSVALGGAGLSISGDGKSATFTDVDGDLVTATRSAGRFVTGDFDFLTAASGGGQLRHLTVTPAGGDAVVTLSITAKPTSDGGNGFVNIGEIDATGVPLGNVTVAGDLGRFVGGLGISGKPGVAALTAHSIGTLGTNTGATSLASSFQDGVGKITIGADLRGMLSAEGTATFGTIAVGGSLTSGLLDASRGIGAVSIKGSVRGSRIISDSGSLGTISIGGDLVGDGVSATISGFGQIVSPAVGPDLAIKSLDVKGNVDKARIDAGIGANADASIGKISVGREWLASTVRAGVIAGKDGFIGTTDDTKTTGISLRDRGTNFSTISSIIIKGQAFGSTMAGDSFGIVAEQIGAAKVGAAIFKFTKGPRNVADFFFAAPTGPGPTGLNFDFAIGEITKP